MSGATTIMAAQPDKPTAVPLQQRPEKKNDDNVIMNDADHEVDESNGADRKKKKRRVIKTSDKKYICPQPECGKTYSRAEHLYRHQLNHTPKQIYHCDFPGCDRNFVRADLCARHKERHTAKGSHLQRKDAFMHNQRVQAAAAASTGMGSSDSGTATTISQSPVDSHHTNQPATQPEQYMAPPAQPHPAYTPSSEHFNNQQPMSELPPMHPRAPGIAESQLSSHYPSYSSNFNGPATVMPSAQPGHNRRVSIEGQLNAPNEIVNGYAQHPQLPMHPPPMSSPAISNQMYGQPQYPSPISSGPGIRSPTGGSYPGLPNIPNYGLPPYGVPGNARPGSAVSANTLTQAEQFQIPPSRVNSVGDFNAMDPYMHGFAMPVFGGDGFSRSPQSALDDTLFNQLLASGDLDLTNPPTPPAVDAMFNSHMTSGPFPKTETEGPTSEPSNHSMAWENISPTINGMDLSMRESSVTERKQSRVIALVKSFEDIDDLTGRKTKDAILTGDTNDQFHPLSINMLKTYLTSFWIHIHQQMPIMHRPTFNAETCPDLLLLAMCCLGACCLERTHTPDVIRNCSELAFFSAYHIRWEVFKDVEFRPTAKLWTFQTMLLLELFEKMYSTRALHERAHIHHATTLTVMRRGSSLIGRSTIESPGNQDITRTPPGPEGSINTSGQNTPDAWWNRWITAEATRRVAFAAFVIDSTHSTLFGHAAVMSPHDIRLPLPCDEALWSATSSAEVQRVEASLAANGFKATSFLEGLKKTLNGQKVRTNIFGRVILMAGLLNVSWHMNQRDLQVSSLGAQNTLLGNEVRWRSPMTRAFDFWRRDFDESLSKMDYAQVANPDNKSRCHPDHRDSVFESRSCLHSLAHMAMHVDIVDCEVFAGSDRALGRVVTDADRALVQKRMREKWAPTARARDATFYALRFLCENLIPEEDLSGNKRRQDSAGSGTFKYSARDDCLLNRPWILYFAVMIVWSYGYALDGPIRPTVYSITSHAAQVEDMQRFLIRMGGVASPDDLENLKDRNSCLGLLLLLRDNFRQPRWELLHEASDQLQRCCELLLPGNSDVKAPLVSAPHT